MSKVVVFVRKYYLFLVLLLLCVFFACMSPKFLTVTNLINIFMQNAYLVVTCTGVAMIMISGGADLSVSYQMSLSAIIAAIAMENGLPVPLAILLALASGAALSGINALCTIKLKMHPMVVTLATMTIYQGFAYLITNAKSYYNFSDSFRFMGQGYLFDTIPFSVVLMFALVLVAIFVLEKTYFGRYIYAIGGNHEAAHLAGINVNLIRVGCFLFAGIYIAISAIMLGGRTGSVSPALGGDAVFTCITACVLGGISFIGGSGRVHGVLISVMILGVLSNGMQLIGMGSYAQYVAKGVILLAAIAFDNYQQSLSLKEKTSSVDKAAAIPAAKE